MPTIAPNVFAAIELAERRAQVALPSQVFRERGERRPHEDRGRAEGHDREGEAGKGEESRCLGERGKGSSVDLVDETERDRRHEHDRDEGELDDAVQPER